MTSRRAPVNEINSIKRQCEKLSYFAWWCMYKHYDGSYQACTRWGAKELAAGGKTELQAWRSLKVKLDELDALVKRLKSC